MGGSGGFGGFGGFGGLGGFGGFGKFAGLGFWGFGGFGGLGVWGFWEDKKRPQGRVALAGAHVYKRLMPAQLAKKLAELMHDMNPPPQNSLRASRCKAFRGVGLRVRV